MANAARLEIELRFGGKDYTIKPTAEVITAVEGATGQSCFALAEKCYAGDPAHYPSFLETSLMVYNIVKPFADDKKFTPEYVANTLMDEGCMDLWLPLARFLSRSLRGHKTHMQLAEQAAREADKAKEAGATEAVVDPPPPASITNGG